MRQPLVAVNDQGRRIGEGHPLARLSDAEVDLIHELREAGMSYGELATRFGVSKSCIAHILTGRRRGEVPAAWVPRPVKPAKPAAPRKRTRTNKRPSQPAEQAAEPQGAVLLQQQLNAAWR